MDYPKTRKEAKESGSKYYFTGQPCKHGHVAPRKTRGVCVECMKVEWTARNAKSKLLPKSEAAKAAGRRYYERNKEAVKARARARAPEEKSKLLPKSEASKAAGRRYYERNKEAVKARARARPPEEKRAWKKAWSQKHKESNPDYYKAATNTRRRRHKQATPKWLTYSQKSDIRHIYQIAVTMTRIEGERYEVDHIIPLLGATVCGLHVPWNLRVITQEENLKKSNKLDGEWFDLKT